MRNNSASTQPGTAPGETSFAPAVDPQLIAHMTRNEADMAFKKRVQTIFEWIEPSDDKTILDMPCGRGFYLNMIRYVSGCTLVGADLDWDVILKARRNVGHLPDIALHNCNIYALPYPDDRFDAVILSEVLEHIDDDRGALRRIARLLRPRGVVIVSVPAFPWLWTRHDESLQHMRRYTRAGLADALGDAGLSWDAGGYFNFRLFPLVAAVRLLHRAKGGGPPHDFSLPPRVLNRILERIFAGEARRLAGRGYPWGVSLLALARAIP